MTMTEAKRGRPRPPEVIGRDREIHQLLAQAGPLTRNEIAERTGLSPSLTYLALVRLKDGRRVKRCLDEETGQSVWTVRVDDPCP